MSKIDWKDPAARREYAKEYKRRKREEDPVKAKEMQDAHHERHKEAKAEAFQRYYEKNREKHLAYMREYHKKNKAKIDEQRKAREAARRDAS